MICFTFNMNKLLYSSSLMPKSLLGLLLVLALFFYTAFTSESQPILEDEQQQYLQQFTQLMANFLPTQAYSFKLQPGETLNLQFWEDDNIDHLRGVFYVSDGINREEGDDFGFTISTMRNNIYQQTFQNKKLGVIKFKYTTGVMNIVFSSSKYKLTVYLSYQLTKKAKVQKIQQKKAQKNAKSQQNQKNQEIKQQEPSRTKISQISDRFLNIQSQIRKLQSVIKLVMHYQEQYKTNIQNSINWNDFRIIFEVILVVLSSSFCLFVLKEKLHKGYQLLV